jgi:hypothetical protein
MEIQIWSKQLLKTCIRDKYPTAQKLKEIISGRNLPLGTTTEGQSWCLKALHPSDPMTEVRGIPDQSSVPSVFLNYQTVHKISPQAGATGTWSFDATLLPHPIALMYCQTTDSVGARFQESLNSQLGGITHHAKYNDFRTFARRWRIAYMSVTAYQDGPALSDQGTLVVAQTPVLPKMFCPSHNYTVVATQTTNVIARTNVAQFTTIDQPNFDASQAMPNSYFNNSKYGAYIPLKLTDTCQKWFSESDNILTAEPYMGGGFDEDNNDYDRNYGALRLPNADPTALAPYMFPFVTLQPAWADPSGVSYGGEVTSALLNDFVAHISGQNLSVATSFSFFIRLGLEIQVQPLSLMSPHQKISPMYDPVALSTYFAISRELKDAYPADYNDLGKILSVIGDAAKFVGGLGAGLGGTVGTIAAGLSAGGTMLGSYGRRISNKSPSAEEEKLTPPAATIDRVQKKNAARNPRNTSKSKRESPSGSSSKGFASSLSSRFSNMKSQYLRAPQRR